MAEILKPSDINKVWSSGGDIISPSDTKIANGWVVEIPPRQWFNWLDNKQDQAIAHMNQHGIPVWDNITEYQNGKSYVQGSDGKLYKCVTTNTNINPVTDTLNSAWVLIGGGSLINVRVFTTTGVYTPTPGTSCVVVEAVGGGGAGGGSSSTTATQYAIGRSGSAGCYGIGRFTSGFSGITITIGAGGVGSAGAAGGNGGVTSFGALMSVPGGVGGQSGAPFTSANPFWANSTPNPSLPTGANIYGKSGTSSSFGLSLSGLVASGSGGDSEFGTGASGTGISTAGNSATSSGGGASGAVSGNSDTSRAGGNGASGKLIVWEYA